MTQPELRIPNPLWERLLTVEEELLRERAAHSRLRAALSGEELQLQRLSPEHFRHYLRRTGYVCRPDCPWPGMEGWFREPNSTGLYMTSGPHYEDPSERGALLGSLAAAENRHRALVLVDLVALYMEGG